MHSISSGKPHVKHVPVSVDFQIIIVVKCFSQKSQPKEVLQCGLFGAMEQHLFPFLLSKLSLLANKVPFVELLECYFSDLLTPFKFASYIHVDSTRSFFSLWYKYSLKLSSSSRNVYQSYTVHLDIMLSVQLPSSSLMNISSGLSGKVEYKEALQAL